MHTRRAVKTRADDAAGDKSCTPAFVVPRVGSISRDGGGGIFAPAFRLIRRVFKFVYLLTYLLYD